VTQLLASDVKTVGSNGRAVCQVQPLRAFEWWHITMTTVQSTSSVLIPTLRLYRGGESPSSLIDGTFRGTLNSTADRSTFRTARDC